MYGRVWLWRDEAEIPNASFWREPWGLYVRFSGIRITAGPKFRWGVKMFPRKFVGYWRWRFHGSPEHDEWIAVGPGKTKIGYRTRRGKVIA